MNIATNRLKPNEQKLFNVINALLANSPIEVRIAIAPDYIFQVVYKSSEYVHETRNTKYCRMTEKGQEEISDLAKQLGFKLTWYSDSALSWEVIPTQQVETEESEYFANN